MMASMRKPWFRPKLYGYGFTPISWEGWLATALFAGGLAATFTFAPGFFSDRTAGAVATAAIAAALIAVFVVVSLRRTEGEMRWRWGRD